jgi:hypothetical protein
LSVCSLIMIASGRSKRHHWSHGVCSLENSLDLSSQLLLFFFFCFLTLFGSN